MQDVLKYLKWEITERGARIIGCDKSFEGAMEIPSFIDGVPVVEVGVLEICAGAFEKCEKITSLTIPDSVEVIGNWAFYQCKNLEELHLGAAIKKIEKGAFANCSSLRGVVLPSPLEERSPDAFSDYEDDYEDEDDLS